MVMLTITPAMLEAIEFCEAHGIDGWPLKLQQDEPDLVGAKLGGAIAHNQIIGLSKCVNKHRKTQPTTMYKTLDASLQNLLRKSFIYQRPSKRKPEPTTEFKQLMARLRDQEESKAYERLLLGARKGPPALIESTVHCDAEDNEMTFADVNRQVALIINVLLSIIACGVAIWVAASHLSTPTRLSLSMGGSGLVGIAEVTIYAGYIRRIKESKLKERKKHETKEIIETWVIESKTSGDEPSKSSESIISTFTQIEGLRHRKTTLG